MAGSNSGGSSNIRKEQHFSLNLLKRAWPRSTLLLNAIRLDTRYPPNKPTNV